MNYMNLIGDYFPETEAECHGDPEVFANITFKSAPLTQEQVEAVGLSKVKEDKDRELSAICGEKITSGFPSNAVGGVTRYYDSTIEDQLNYIGAATSGEYMPLAPRATPGGVKEWVVHSPRQLKTVLEDGKNWKLTHLETFYTRRAQIQAATTVAEVEAITWD